MKFAQILYDKAHWIFEADERPEFAPNIVLVDISNLNPQPQEGWRYIDGAFVELTIPMLTPQEIQKQLADAVQRHMDATAQANGYDNILSAATYAEEPTIPKFQAEGMAYRAWRSQVWDYCYAQLDKVLAGQREVPTAEALIAELPELSLTE